MLQNAFLVSDSQHRIGRWGWNIGCSWCQTGPGPVNLEEQRIGDGLESRGERTGLGGTERLVGTVRIYSPQTYRHARSLALPKEVGMWGTVSQFHWASSSCHPHSVVRDKQSHESQSR